MVDEVGEVRNDIIAVVEYAIPFEACMRSSHMANTSGTSFNLLAANIALHIIGDENCARLHETLHQNRNVLNRTVRRRHILHVELNDMQLLGGIVVWYVLDAQFALPLLNPFGDLSGQLVQLTLLTVCLCG